MRLQKYLTEQPGRITTVVEILKRDCKPYLKEWKKCKKYWLIRWVNIGIGIPEDIIRKRVREQRKPKDIPENIHKVIDDAFLRNFGWRARSNVVFGYGYSKFLAGANHLLFPIGKFKYVWSPEYADLYVNYIRSEDFYHTDIDDKSEMDNLMRDFTNKKFCKALESGNEIMINCKEYYIVNQKFREHLNELL